MTPGTGLSESTTYDYYPDTPFVSFSLLQLLIEIQLHSAWYGPNWGAAGDMARRGSSSGCYTDFVIVPCTFTFRPSLFLILFYHIKFFTLYLKWGFWCINVAGIRAIIPGGGVFLYKEVSTLSSKLNLTIFCHAAFLSHSLILSQFYLPAIWNKTA